MTLLVIGNYDNLNLDNDALTNKINVPHFVEKIIVHGFDIWTSAHFYIESYFSNFTALNNPDCTNNYRNFKPIAEINQTHYYIILGHNTEV